MKDYLVLQGVRLILQGLEVDPKDRNYVKTPHRVLAFYKELFNKPNSFPPTFEEPYDQMITLRHHKAWTLCPHHLLPVSLDISIAYIPNGVVIGLSKMARIAEACLNKPALQEDVTNRVVDDIMANVKPTPVGAACIIRGEHLCMKARGVRSSGDIVTSAMRGALLDKPAARAEFLQLVNHA